MATREERTGGIPPDRARLRLLAAAVALACICCFWLANTFFGARSDILPEELPGIALLTAAAVAVQVALIAAFRRFALPLAATFGAIDSYSLHGILSPGLASLPLYAQAAVCVGMGLLYFALLRLWTAAPRRYVLAGVIALPVLLTGYVGYRLVLAAGPDAGAPAIQQVGTDSIARPNIYFLSFDSLLPESLAARFLGISRPAYLDVLEKHGGRMLPNTFADAVATKMSLSSVLMLRPHLAGMDGVVNGFTPSPLRDALRGAGYETHFTFELFFFGHGRGPHLDHYNSYEPYSLCDFLRGKRAVIGFFGYCGIGAFKVLHPREEARPESYEDYSFALIRAVSERRGGRPQFYMEHVLKPDHASPGYGGSPAEKAALVERYLGSAAEATRMMDRALTQIRAADPGAIIFVYGDHGAFTARHKEYADDPRTFVVDRHGTLAAVINADHCLPYIDAATGGRYHTTAQIASGIVQCVTPGQRHPWAGFDYNPIRQIAEEERFATYVYE